MAGRSAHCPGRWRAGRSSDWHSYWAYETLGWGGYWGWDPVENSSLVPWLTATALIHAMLVQRTHGALRRSTFVLAILTYMLIFYATFLTRSGILSNFSVHSFAQEGLKVIMTTALGVITVSGVAVLVWRWRDIPSRTLSEKLLSRDSFFVLLILGLLVIATVIGFGTSMPVISAISGVGHTLRRFFRSAFELDDGTRYNPNASPFTDGRFGLIGSFYTATVPPLGVILVLLLTIGSLLGWRDTNMRHLLKALRWPALAAVALTCGMLLIGVRDLLPLAYIGLGTFAVGTNVVMIIRTLRSGWLRIGDYLAHVGMAVLIAGVVGSTSYATPDQKIVVSAGDAIRAYGYDFTFNGWRTTPQGKGMLDMTVRRDNDTFSATPLLYYNQRMGATTATPSIKSEFVQDLYISPVEYQPPIDRNTAQLLVNDKKEIGPYTITFLGFDAAAMHGGDSGDIGARLRVTYQGQDTIVKPVIRVMANESDPAKAFQRITVALPGGKDVMFEHFDPVQRWAFVRVNGLNLPVDPAKAVVTVSLKPGIALVWLGIVIGVLG